MSTILKALRRLQEEKNRGEEPNLREDVVLAPEPAPRRSGRWLLAIGAGAVAFVLAVVALVAWERRGAAPAGGETEVAQASPPPSGPTGAVPAMATPEPSPVAPTAPASPGPTPEPTPIETSPATAPPQEAATPVATPRVTPPPTPRVTATPRVTPPPTPRVTATPRVTPPPTPRVTATPAPAKPAPRKVPLTVERIQWHPDPAKRVAWIRVQGESAPQEVRENDRVGPYRVETIEPAALLFVDGPVEVRRKLGAP